MIEASSNEDEEGGHTRTVCLVYVRNTYMVPEYTSLLIRGLKRRTREAGNESDVRRAGWRLVAEISTYHLEGHQEGMMAASRVQILM